MDPIMYHEARDEVSRYGQELLSRNLTRGTGGNISRVTDDGNVAISPTGVQYGDISPEDVPIIGLDGEVVRGTYEPSVESPMHTMVYRERDDVEAIVHTHSTYASTFACLGEPIPPTHYLIACVGDEIPVAGYATFGTEELGELVVDALGNGYRACLLRNHGVLAVGESLQEALENALVVEFCAQIHYQATLLGNPVRLPPEELARLHAKFEEYGQ